ncbi:AAA family ATPase [Halorussus marinus]|uniref:AAA family ATPase n=1 Tax=Halorussus marinus TaxID=2505976 RepID=UPI00106ED906|nr:AAA family ATPase [Halorussus marinus]
MSDSMTEVVTAEEGGVVVEKSFEGDEFAVPAIKFVIRSERDDSTTITLADDVPESFPMDNVGFHPDYENDNWTAYKDHRVQFERELDPGEELVTVYGVRLGEDDDPSIFLGSPTIEQVAPASVGGTDEADGGPDPLGGDVGDDDPLEDGPDPLGGEVGGPEGNTITDIVSEEDSQIVRDVVAGEEDLSLDDEADAPTDGDEPLADPDGEAGAGEESDPLAEDEASAGPPDEDGEPSTDDLDEADPLGAPDERPADADDPSAPDEGTDDSTGSVSDEGVDDPMGDEPDEATPAADHEPDSSADAGTASPPTPGSVAATLAEEIRAGEVSDDDLDVIQRELDVETPESTNVRIRHLQSRVEDLSAYTEALEEFIDENGVAEDVFADFETDIASLRADVEAFEDEVQAIRTDADDTDDRVAELDSSLSGVESEVDEVAEGLAAVEEDLDDVADLDAVEALREDLTDLEADLDSVGDLREQVSALEAELEDAGDFEAEFDALDDRIDDLEELVGANTEDVTAVGAEVEELTDEMADLRTEIEAATDAAEEIESVAADVESLSDDLDALEENLTARVESVEDEVADIREGVERDVADIREEIDGIQEWRDRISDVFGN